MKNVWLSIVAIILFSTLTHSQNNSSTLERKISYFTLNEFGKLLEHSNRTDSILVVRETELKSLHLVVDTDQKTIFQLEKFVIPSLNNKIQVRDSTIINQNTVFKTKLEVKDVELKEQKNKKWTWLGGGTLIGIILGLVFGG